MGTHADTRTLARPSKVFSLIVPLSAIAAVGLSGYAGDIAAASQGTPEIADPANTITSTTTVQAPRSAEAHQTATLTAEAEAAAAQEAADAAMRALQQEALAQAESPLTQYLIQPGDTLTHIAQTLGWGEIAAVATWNSIPDANLIIAGRTLYRPGFTPSATAAIKAPLSSLSTPAHHPVDTVTLAQDVDLGEGATITATAAQERTEQSNAAAISQSILDHINSRRPTSQQLSMGTHDVRYSGHASATIVGDAQDIGEWDDIKQSAVIENSQWTQAHVVAAPAGSISGKPVWYVDVFLM